MKKDFSIKLSLKLRCKCINSLRCFWSYLLNGKTNLDKHLYRCESLRRRIEKLCTEWNCTRLQKDINGFSLQK